MLTKKVIKKVVRPGVKTSEAQLSSAKDLITTRTSARVKPTSILEKSKQLIKKAVQKSKEKIKVSPVAVRRLRSRTKPAEDANQKETVVSSKEVSSQDEEAEDTVEPMEEDVDKDDDNSEKLKESKDSSKDETEDKSVKFNEDQEMEDITTVSNQEDNINKVEKINTPKKDANKKDNQNTPMKSQAILDCTATPEKSSNDDENKSPDIIASKDQPSLEEHIDALAKNKASLFDSLWSEPSKKKKDSKKGKSSEDPSNAEVQAEHNKAAETGVELDSVELQQFDLPLLDTGEPLTVDTNTGPTTQPMFSPDDDSDTENTSVTGKTNFLVIFKVSFLILCKHLHYL